MVHDSEGALGNLPKSWVGGETGEAVVGINAFISIRRNICDRLRGSTMAISIRIVQVLSSKFKAIPIHGQNYNLPSSCLEIDIEAA